MGGFCVIPNTRDLIERKSHLVVVHEWEEKCCLVMPSVTIRDPFAYVLSMNTDLFAS